MTHFENESWNVLLKQSGTKLKWIAGRIKRRHGLYQLCCIAWSNQDTFCTQSILLPWLVHLPSPQTLYSVVRCPPPTTSSKSSTCAFHVNMLLFFHNKCNRLPPVGIYFTAVLNSWLPGRGAVVSNKKLYC